MCLTDTTVEEQHPLKQGLKHYHTSPTRPAFGGRRATSTKTRIETKSARMRFHLQIRVEEQHPLKQGLKHHLYGMYSAGYGGRRATSTKTRIETMRM